MRRKKMISKSFWGGLRGGVISDPLVPGSMAAPMNIHKIYLTKINYNWRINLEKCILVQ